MGAARVDAAARRVAGSAGRSTRPVRRAGRAGPLTMGSGEDRARGAQRSGARSGCGAPGEYQLQAAITALHMEAAGDRTGRRSPSCTPRSRRSAPRPSSKLNRAAAVGFAAGTAGGPAAARAATRRPAARALPAALRHARRAASRCGRHAAAETAYQRAIALTTNGVERAELQRRLRSADRAADPVGVSKSRGAAASGG